MTASRLSLLLVSALACVACQVGDPLVDVFPSDDGGLRILCTSPPECEPVARGEGPMLAAVPMRFVCAEQCSVLSANGDSVSCPASALAQLPSTVHCRDIELQLPAATSELRVEAVDWRNVNVRVSAHEPLTLVLQGGTLAGVYFELEGPITLHMDALRSFADLRLVARGAARVAIAAESGSELVAGSMEEPIAGEIVISAGSYDSLDVRAASFTAESATLTSARLETEMITLTDVSLQGAMVKTQHALWSAFSADNADLQFCGEARLIQGTMARCAVSACEGSNVRMFNDSFVSGSLDGDFELSDGNVETTQLGLRAATRVFAYGSSLSSVRMCDATQQVVLGSASTVKCSACEESIVASFPVCSVGDRAPKWLRNFCPAWASDVPLPECAEGTPAGSRRAR